MFIISDLGSLMMIMMLYNTLRGYILVTALLPYNTEGCYIASNEQVIYNRCPGRHLPGGVCKCGHASEPEVL